MTIKTANEKTIKEAAILLNAGGLVAMPTETVYGLAANAFDGQAVARIFEAKGRPSFNPLIVHVADTREAEELVDMDDRALAVAEAFWPGPLTLILPRRDDCEVSELVSAGLPTLAVRVPRHKVTQDLIKASGLALAAPSANRSGSLSPTAPIHVADSLGDSLTDGVDLILAAGPSEVGLESTVLDLSGEEAIILRPGAITPEDISAVLDEEVAIETGESDAPQSKVKSPGMVLKHYAPETPVRLNAIDMQDGEALLAFGSTKFMVGADFPQERLRNLSEGQDLHEAAANLFAMLKDLDQPEHKAIAVMQIPNEGLGFAINDRLKRASQAEHDDSQKRQA